jgi:hypothetical protein
MPRLLVLSLRILRHKGPDNAERTARSNGSHEMVQGGVRLLVARDIVGMPKNARAPAAVAA